MVAHRRCCWGSHIAISRKWLVNGDAGWPAMVDGGKLSSVGAGRAFVLHLCTHGCGMRLVQRSQFRGPRTHLDSTRSAVETHTGICPAVPANRAVVHVVYDGDVDVIDRSVVVEVATTPITALVAEADIAKAIVDAAIVADVPAPIAAVKAITVIPKAPVAGGPKCALVGCFNPRTGYPVIALRRPGPITGSPDIVVTGSLRLIVVGQRRRRFGSIGRRLLSVTRIFRRLVGRLVRAVALVLRRWILLIAGSGRGSVKRSARVV